MKQTRRTSQPRIARTTIVMLLFSALNANGQSCPGIKPTFHWANEGSAIVFTDLTEGDISYRLWEFGDGDSSNDQSVAHLYDFADVDTVRLTVWSYGCSFEVAGIVGHGGEDDACDSQVASHFTAEPAWNNTMLFVDQSQGDGSPLLYFWAYGDDSISFLPVDTHFYALPGAYDVTHSITTLDSLFQTACVAGCVQRVFVDGNTSTCDSSVFLDLSVTLENNVLTAEATTVLFDTQLVQNGFWWDYGDNSEDVSSNPGMEHLYPYWGEYQVCVEAQFTDQFAPDTTCYARACSTVIAPPTVGVQEMSGKDTLRAWPIPCTDKVRIEGTQLARGGAWRILDALGRELRSGAFAHDAVADLDLTGLPEGLLMLMVPGAVHVSSLRLLKQ
jgi:hypothetical protein